MEIPVAPNEFVTQQMIDDYTKAGYRGTKILSDYASLNASTQPLSEAIVWEGGRLTWSDYDQRMRNLALGFRELGIGKGDTVAILLPAGPEYHILLDALPLIVAIPVALMMLFGERDVEYALGTTGLPKCLFSTANRQIFMANTFAEACRLKKGDVIFPVAPAWSRL